MAKQAIGMIETKGFCTMMEATDAALKSADVQMTGWEKIGGGLVTVFLSGDIAAVKAAVEAGAEAARSVGEVRSVAAIPGPHDDLSKLGNWIR